MKQHYVPAFYLRAFTDPNCPAGYKPYLWIVELNSGKIHCQPPAKTAASTDYYVVDDKSDRNEVEKQLGEVESKAAPIVQRILADATEIEPDEQAILSYFMAIQIVRVPQTRTRIARFLKDIVDSMKSLMNLAGDSRADELREHP